MGSHQTVERVEKVLRQCLRLGASAPIGAGMALVGGDHDLDSLDILLVITQIEKEFGIAIPNEAVGRDAFKTVATLAAFVEKQSAQVCS